MSYTVLYTNSAIVYDSVVSLLEDEFKQFTKPLRRA